MPFRYEDQYPQLLANLNAQSAVTSRDQSLLNALETLRTARIMTSSPTKRQFYVEAFNEIKAANEASQGTNTTAIGDIDDVDTPNAI